MTNEKCKRLIRPMVLGQHAGGSPDPLLERPSPSGRKIGDKSSLDLKQSLTERIRKMLKKFIFSLTAIMALSLIAIAQEGKITLTGHLVDKACATGKVAKQTDPQAASANETKGCILMDGCLKSGLGIYADG